MTMRCWHIMSVKYVSLGGLALISIKKKTTVQSLRCKKINTTADDTKEMEKSETGILAFSTYIKVSQYAVNTTG